MIPMRSAGLGCLSRQVKPRIGCFNQFQPASVWAAFDRSEKKVHRSTCKTSWAIK